MKKFKEGGVVPGPKVFQEPPSLPGERIIYKKMSNTKTMYSLEQDNETWYCNDIDELIQQGIEDGCLTPEESSEVVVYSGTCEIRKASSFLGDMVEMLTDNAVEECGEVAGSWLDGSGEMLQRAMSECLDNWCDQYGKTVHFGCIENIKSVHIIILKIQGDDVQWAYRDGEQ